MFLSTSISEKSLESFLAGIFVQQTFAFLRIKAGRLKLVPGLAQLREPFFVFRAELFFELLSESLGESRTLSRGGNGDLQRSALHHCRIVEIAKTRNIYDIAEHASPRRLFENALMEFRRRSGRNNQEHSFKIA